MMVPPRHSHAAPASSAAESSAPRGNLLRRGRTLHSRSRGLMLLVVVVLASSSFVAQALTSSSRLDRSLRPEASSTKSSIRPMRATTRRGLWMIGFVPRGASTEHPSPTSRRGATSRAHEGDSRDDKLVGIQRASALQGLVVPAGVASLLGPVCAALQAALLGRAGGPLAGLGALTFVASLVVVPLTQVKNLYAISVGYGMSVGVLGMALRRTLDPLKDSIGHTLSGCTVFYGFRLAIYLYTRERAGWKPSSSSSSSATAPRKEPARLQRIPFSVTLALFYACLTMPVLHVLRSSPALPFQGWKWYVAWTGTIVAWTGAVLEAVADTHKFLVKNQYAKEEENDGAPTETTTPEFVGPVNGAYALTRHPNYTGEILHWFGTYLAGTVCFGKSYVGWISSTVGLYGIVSIMVAATKGLEKRQQDKYVGDPAYENWKARVAYPLLPFVRGPLPTSSPSSTAS